MLLIRFRACFVGLMGMSGGCSVSFTGDACWCTGSVPKYVDAKNEPRYSQAYFTTEICGRKKRAEIQPSVLDCKIYFLVIVVELVDIFPRHNSLFSPTLRVYWSLVAMVHKKLIRCSSRDTDIQYLLNVSYPI